MENDAPQHHVPILGVVGSYVALLLYFLGAETRK